MKRLCSFSSGNSQQHIPYHLSTVLNKHSMPDISAFQKSSACSCAWVFDTSRSKEDRAFWVECCKAHTPRKACQERSVAKRPDDDPLRLAQGCLIVCLDVSSLCPDILPGRHPRKESVAGSLSVTRSLYA